MFLKYLFREMAAWKCTCGAWNFATRTHCRVCGLPKPK